MICRFDPFVGFFRRTGAPHMLLIGGAFLLAGMFIGRPYCRYLCPYGGLLAWCTRLARRGVTITPDKELDCGLCTGRLPLWRDREDARRAPQLSVLRALLCGVPARRGVGACQDATGAVVMTARAWTCGGRRRSGGVRGHPAGRLCGGQPGGLRVTTNSSRAYSFG